MDELWKLENVDTAESRRVAARLQARLKASREPTLLSELVELYFKTGSKRARKILTTLRETHSQDFFDKLDDSVADTSTRLPALKLLAHTLNSQTSWLYRIVDHPLFSSILDQLKTSGDVVVLSNALFVVSAILPMVPSYIGGHLQDIFAIFCDLATIRTTNRLGLTPKELHLHLDVAVYYFFMQLYALFPCNLSQFLKAHYAHSSQEEVAKIQEYILPLFYHVQLHPGLITGGEKVELSKAKWGAMEPLDIATLSYQLCMDTSLAVQEEKRQAPSDLAPPQARSTRHQSGWRAATSTTTPHVAGVTPQAQSCDSCRDDAVESVANDSSRELLKTPSTPLFLIHSMDIESGLQPQAKENNNNCSTVVAGPERGMMDGGCEDGLDLQESSTHALSGLPDPVGFKSSQELSLFWSPSITLGNAPSRKSISHDSSRTSLTQQSLQPSNISSPISDSALSSAQPTPGPTTSTANAFTFTKNYSPTASVDGESLANRQMVQSSIHTPSCLEDSHSSTSLEPLTQSLRADMSFRSSTGTGSGLSSPSQSLMGSHGGRSQLSTSFRARLGRFINFLSPKKAEQEGEEFSELSSTAENEEFTEINVNELERAQQRSRLSAAGAKIGILSSKNVKVGGARASIEVGEECVGVEDEPKRRGQRAAGLLASREVTSVLNTGAPSDRGEVKVNEDEDGGASKADDGDLLKISNLPDSSSRTSRSSSQSSQGSSSAHTNDESPLCSTHQPLLLGMSGEERRVASSMPESGAFSSVQRMRHARTRSSNSDHTVLMVQERLQELVESEKNSSSSSQSEQESILGESGSTTLAVEQSCQLHLPHDVKRPTSLTVPPNDDPSLSKERSLDKEGYDGTLPRAFNAAKSTSVDLEPRTDSNVALGFAPKSSALSGPAYSSSLPSRLFMRRVSVCHPLTTSGDPVVTHSTNQNSQTPTTAVDCTTRLGNPSPVSLLDQFVSRGEVLHRGQFESIPLTELEGVDWTHFGGCPHSEEFGMMRSQVALLHSQLLFERHQCLQHARRNRRLLSKARSTMQVAEKLYSLRDQLDQKEQLVISLREHLQETASQQRASNIQKKLSEANQHLMSQNAKLKETNLGLSEEAHRLKQHNEQLLQELKHAHERLVKMEDERSHMEPKLRRAEQLKKEVDSLSCELQLMGELCQQQREEAQALTRPSQREQEMAVLCAAMRKEKEASQKVIASLNQRLLVSLARVDELEQNVSQREEEIAALGKKLVSAQGRHQAKMKAVQDKYTSIVVVGQQLETQILELRGRPTHHKKKYATRHQRSSSHPSSVAVTQTPPPAVKHSSQINSPSLVRHQ